VPAERSRSGRRATTPGRLPGLVLVVLLLGLAAWSVAALQPPAPKSADAPVGEFSAARAFAHVQQLGAQTHVAGSKADSQVVDHLVTTLTGLGLDTRVQNAVGTWGVASGATDMARVHNVVGYLKGSNSTGRLYLMAHHDSVQNGPGGSDDGAGVSTLLETVRALTSGPPLRNDVIVVFTDAEEACLCGAQAFVSSHPLAGSGGVALNFEARGTSGPPIMFETSRGNARLAEAFAQAAPHPVATSFAVEVYRALPNDTDFSVLLADGRFSGLNTAWIDGAAAYHTAQDRPERMNQASLQAMGDNAVAVVRSFGNRNLKALAKPAAQDATYFPVLDRLVHYPGSLVWPLAGAALLGVAVLALVLRRRGISSLRRTAGATGLALVPLAAGPLAAQGLWALLILIRPGYGAMLDPWRPGWYRLAVVAVVLAVVLIWFGLLRRRIGVAPLAAGALVWLAVLGAVLAAYAPGGSYLAAWPALAGALAGIVAAVTGNRAVRLVAALIAGAVAVLVLAPTVVLFFPALGLRTGAVAAFFATLLAMALIPALDLVFPEEAGRGRLAAAAVPGVALVLSVACAAIGLSVDRFDTTHPVPSQLVYALDRDTGKAWWASTEAHPGAYTARYVSGRSTLPVDFPYLAGLDVATGPAQVADLPAPLVTPVSDGMVGGKRVLTVRVTSQRPGVRLLMLDLDIHGGTVVRAQVAGRSVPDAALGEDHVRITFHAPPADGLQVIFTLAGGGPATLRAADGSDGLSGLPGFQPRPDDVGAAGTHSSDLVLVSATTALG
jgi:hypothetical protein